MLLLLFMLLLFVFIILTINDDFRYFYYFLYTIFYRLINLQYKVRKDTYGLMEMTGIDSSFRLD